VGDVAVPPFVRADPPFVAIRLAAPTPPAILARMAKHNGLLTITSLLSILLMTFHLSDDIVRGFEPGGVKNVSGILILVVWLYATLVLAERRWGYVIVFLGSLLGSGVPVFHMTRAGLVGGRIANSSGKFFWVWTLIALGVTAMFSLILSARALWSLQWRRQTRPLNTSSLEH
jgi:hypothetical protein